MNKPFFCATGDVDWVSEYCIQDYINVFKEFDIKPTLFATHDSAVIKENVKKGLIEVGIHPNFHANSTQGKNYVEIIDNLFKMYPEAKSFRSHGFFDGSHILMEMVKRGVKYDSNICLHLQPNITPLALGDGPTRYPVFWEDDCHWIKPNYTWDVNDYLAYFMTGGLKILNLHPFMVTANIPNFEYYEKIKHHIPTISEKNIDEIRYKGKGVRTFLIDLLKAIAQQKERFYTLSELYQLVPIGDFLLKRSDQEGRGNDHSDQDHDAYWNMSDQEKQEFLRLSYEKRNSKDIYATSRDFQIRELEIESIKRQLKNKGKVIDLGCGNGYTLISLASQLSGFEMTGIDFSNNLIEGANHILNERKDQIKSKVNFKVSDAIAYVKEQATNSCDYIITERFIQNLPTKAMQQTVLTEIHRALKPGGKLLMCEASENGFLALNDIRAKLNLEVTLATSKDNVSAIRLIDEELEDYNTGKLGFALEGKYGYSDYFLISRVLHPLYVAPQSPRFDSKINELARMIQEQMPFNTGFGSNVLWVFIKK